MFQLVAFIRVISKHAKSYDPWPTDIWIRDKEQISGPELPLNCRRCWFKVRLATRMKEESWKGAINLEMREDPQVKTTATALC